MKRKDLTGMQYGKLAVQEMIYGEVHGGRKRTRCVCKCECGNTITTSMDGLTSGKKTSCGCDTAIRRISSLRKDLTGKTFNRLTAIEMIWGTRPTMVRCSCKCGNTTIVAGTDLTNGHTKSCGCLQKEAAALSNTKVWTDAVSKYGITFIEPHKKDKRGRWLWNCRCGVCGSIFLALPAKIMNGHITSCGCRNRSSREDLIRNILTYNKVNFIEQYRFNDCRSTYTLPFDFAVFDGGKLSLLIEYDGKQHYMPIPHFGGIDGLTETKIRDSIKNQYCTSNNISLLRLPYTLTDTQIQERILNTIYPQRL